MELYRLEVELSGPNDEVLGGDIIYCAHNDPLAAIDTAEKFLKQINGSIKYQILSYEAMPAGTSLYGRILASAPIGYQSDPVQVQPASRLII